MTRRLLGGAAALALALGTASGASAGLVLELDPGTGPADVLTIADNGPGDSEARTGAITYLGGVGAFAVDLTTVLSKPLLGNSPETAQMVLSHLSLTTTTGGSLRLRLTDDDFTLATAAPHETVVLYSRLAGVITGSGALQAAHFVDLDNAPFGTAGPNVFGFVHPSMGPGAFSDTQTGKIAYAGESFSMTKLVELTLARESSATFEMNGSAEVPEPAALALLGLGLTGLGAFRRRRAA